jgi:hypothetical protein
MKISRVNYTAPTTILFLFFFCRCADAQIPGLGDCTRARDRYTELNDPLLLKSRAAAKLRPDIMEAKTETLEMYVTGILEARLSDSGDPGVIRDYLKCIQERDGEMPEPGDTNTPEVFIAGPQRSLAVSAMLIMRGGNVIPQTRELVACFARSGSRWLRVPGNVGDSGFDSHTLFIHPLRSPVAGEDWYLLSGRAIGSTGGILRLEIVGCSGQQFRSVWRRDGIRWGKIEVDEGGVKLTYEKQGIPGLPLPQGQKLGVEFVIVDASYDPIRFSEFLKVTKNGLEP